MSSDARAAQIINSTLDLLVGPPITKSAACAIINRSRDHLQVVWKHEIDASAKYTQRTCYLRSFWNSVATKVESAHLEVDFDIKKCTLTISSYRQTIPYTINLKDDR